MVVRVVNESERTDATRLQSQIVHHPFRRSEGQFAGSFQALGNQHILEPMLNVVNRQIVVAGEADQVVLIALVVAHKNVLAMHTPVVVPPPFGFLYRLAFRVIVRSERDVMLLQIAQHTLLPIG